MRLQWKCGESRDGYPGQLWGICGQAERAVRAYEDGHRSGAE